MKTQGYDIIQGKPEYVRKTVQALLKLDWDINGPLIPIEIDGKTIVAQGMIKYDKTSKVS